MVEQVKFYLLNQILNRGEGVIVDGDLYLCDNSAKDAFLEQQGKTRSLRYQGCIGDIVSAEEVIRSDEIRKFKQQAVDAAFSKLLGTTQSLDALLVFQCMHDILPYLDEFDSRVNDMPRSELVELRRKELFDQIPSQKGAKQARLSRSKVRSKITQIIFDMYEDREQEVFTRFDGYEQSLIFDEEQIHQLIPKQYRGDVIFWRNRGKKRLFKRGERVKGLSSRLDRLKTTEMLTEIAEEITDERINAFIQFYKKIHAGYEIAATLKEYEHSGMFQETFGNTRSEQMALKKSFFVYVHPPGFAMHSPYNAEQWYPFPNPTRAGVQVGYGKDGSVYVSDFLVQGPFNYLNFEVREGCESTFCGPGNYKPKPNGTWQESVVDYILHGVHTLFNGWQAGATAHPDKFVPITEQEVEKLGLLKTNIHPIERQAK